MLMPTVSVIIPSYNHEKFVAEAIQSVLDQTYQDFEIIITDDGSSDQTVNLIKQFKDPRIQLFCFEKNQGACIAANNCLKHAKGKYIAMLSSDDVFLPEKLAKQVAYLQSHSDCAAVFSEAHIIQENGDDFKGGRHFYTHIFSQKNKSRYEWLNYFFYQGNCLCHPSVLIRKECYDQVGVYDSRLAQLPDFDMWIRLCLAYEIHILPEQLIKFRILQGDKNASGHRPDTALRKPWEQRIVLENFLRIKSIAEFKLVFPDKIVNDNIDSRLIPFYVAQAALAVKRPMYNQFAIQALFNLLAIFPQELKQNCDFTYKDFINLTGNIDLFGYYTPSGRVKRTLFAAKRIVKTYLAPFHI